MLSITVYLMPNFSINQKGIIPVILIIILSVVFAGAAGVVYNSRKEIKIKQDKTYETTDITKTTKSGETAKPVTNVDQNAVAADKTGKLAQEPFKQTDFKLPKFSFFPPDGWSKEGANYTAPTKDKISEGIAYLAISPSINIAAVPKDFDDLEGALAFMKSEVKKNGIEINSSRKTQLNGEDAYFVEGIMRYGEISRSALETEIEAEIKKAEKKVIVSEADIKRDLDEIVKKGDVKIIGYLFYKDGYAITYSGRALVEFWDKRGPQIKRSLDTFKFE